MLEENVEGVPWVDVVKFARAGLDVMSKGEF
jgi:hypothetical protein